MMRQNWIDMQDELPITRLCDLAGVLRTTVYTHQQPKGVDDQDQLLRRLINVCLT
jgi:hypothetical protein